MTPEQKDAQARNRYFVMVFSRLLGASLTVFGMVVLAGRFETLPPAFGLVLTLTGLMEMALVPRMLARKWRTPPEA